MVKHSFGDPTHCIYRGSLCCMALLRRSMLTGEGFCTVSRKTLAGHGWLRRHH